jgi:arsenite-transporting ATPase
MSPLINPSFLLDSPLKLVFFGGKGGVGKSTCATATALKLAQSYPQKHFLLVSTDPAHCLNNILSNCELPTNLNVRELSAADSLHKFKLKNDAFLKEIAVRGTFLDESDLHGLMDSALPGMDELAAYLEIAQWLKEDNYARIIIDTAPTGHTLRLLAMPDLIHRWLNALDTLLSKHRYMRSHFGKDNRLDHLDTFLLDMNATLKMMQALITDKARCRFVIVMLPEAMITKESMGLVHTLDQKRITVSDVIFNKMYPKNECPVCVAEYNRQAQSFQYLLTQLQNYNLWSLPFFLEEPRAAQLTHVISELRVIDKNQQRKRVPNVLLPVHVETPTLLPLSPLRLMIFAGKGGVGKTTIACATALRLHKKTPQLRILLLSSDPAHSLSDCLNVSVKSIPSSICLNVDAQEINVDDGFEKIRRSYRAELADFLGKALPNLDITFDREVMERLLDLAPPGLDEIIALTSIIAHLETNRYDTIIIDAAPSGHLLRLLELPELIQDWLKLFFSLLLKYRKVMHLPELSNRLVKLSKEIKVLRALLQEPEQTGLYAVTIPTYLAMDKTYEMTQALARLGITIKALFINQLTPVSECNLCQALVKRELVQLNFAQEQFSGLSQTRVYRQCDPTGLEGLTQLGLALYL